MTRDVTGSYWCSIVEAINGGFDEREPCVIKKLGQQLLLVQLGGNALLRGEIALDGTDGFRFVGKMYCPSEVGCTRNLHGRFKPLGRGGFQGKFREEALVMHLTPAGFGGSEYGDPFGSD